MIVLGSQSLVAGMPGSKDLAPAEVKHWLGEPAVHHPLDYCLPLGLHAAKEYDRPKLTRAKIELGRQLFFDHRPAKSGMKCATCHGEASFTSVIGPNEGQRNPNPIINRILSQEQFWDGHAQSLHEQPWSPVTSPNEMNTTPAELVTNIEAIEGYRLQFDKIYGAVNFDNYCDALVAFECTLVTGPSAWDCDVALRELGAKDESQMSAEERALLAEARAGAEREPLPAAARRGAELFFSERTKCATCHSGPNFTDEDYHRLGVEPVNDDPGRFAVTKQEADRGAFKTPTLRNVAATAPYMHNGRFQHLSEAVAWVLGGGEGPHSDLQPVDATPEELDDLVAFLGALSSKVPQPEQGKLPR